MAKPKQTQVDKFKQTARELETDDDEKHFDEKLEKIARHGTLKPEAKSPKKTND